MNKFLVALLAICGVSVVQADKGNPIVIEIEIPDRETFAKKSSSTRSLLISLTQNHPHVTRAYDAFSKVLEQAVKSEKSISEADSIKILKGVEFAAEMHRSQKRKNSAATPYIAHPIGVAVDLMQVGKVRDPDLIIGALLHDCMEEEQTTFTEIEKQFGAQVASFVREVSEEKSIPKAERRRSQLAHAAHKSAGAAQIKLADTLHNLKDLHAAPPIGWNRERVDQYYQWAQSVINQLPAANEELKKASLALIAEYWESQAK